MDHESHKRVEILENYSRVLDRISKAAVSAGRNHEDIRLVVVTKTQPVEILEYVIEAGARDLGENYVEEGIQKIRELSTTETIRWHMIGHLQSRKAQIACEHFQYLHSLDSLKLAERLCRTAGIMNKTMPVWLEFNVSGEETKSGWRIDLEENWSNSLPDLEKIFQLTNLDVLGLMAIPPYSDDPESSRKYFKQLRRFQDYVINKLKPANFREMSIGMSSDYEVAIQEGSTCVRVGQAILGPRPV